MRCLHLAVAAATGALLLGALGVRTASAAVAHGNSVTCTPPTFAATCSDAEDSQEVLTGVDNLLSMANTFLSTQTVSGNQNRVSLSNSALFGGVTIQNVQGNLNTLSASNAQGVDVEFCSPGCLSYFYYATQAVTGNDNQVTSAGMFSDTVTGNGNSVTDTGSRIEYSCGGGPTTIVCSLPDTNTTTVNGNSNQLTVTGYGDTVSLGTPQALDHGDVVNVSANDATVTIDGNGDDLTVPVGDDGDMIVCTGNGITSLSSRDCSVTP